MQNRPDQGIQHNNRIQYKTTADARKIFSEYWIHEWDGKGYDMNEHINVLEKAIKRAEELGYHDDTMKLEGFK
jgi:hypothetical protein